MTSRTSTSAATTIPRAHYLEGWVRNPDDGRVVVEEGDSEGDLDGFQKR